MCFLSAALSIYLQSVTVMYLSTTTAIIIIILVICYFSQTNPKPQLCIIKVGCASIRKQRMCQREKSVLEESIPWEVRLLKDYCNSTTDLDTVSVAWGSDIGL